MMKPALAAAVLSALALSACEKVPEPPFDRGVCYHAVPQADGMFKYNPVKRDVTSIELCAAELEGMRVRFLRMGGGTRELVGAYQGRFLIVNPAGIFSRQKWDGAQFLLLVRTGDGRLAQPGAVPSY